MDQAPGGEAVMKVRMKVEGGDKIARKLQMMAEEVARTHMRECALAGAEVIRAEAATLAPVSYTHLDVYKRQVAEGLAIYNVLRRHKAKVKTYCEGFACSAASVVFMAGDERIMSNASLLMIHNAWMLTLSLIHI